MNQDAHFAPSLSPTPCCKVSDIRLKPARDLLFRLFPRLFSRALSKREFLVNNPSEAPLYPYKPATLIVELPFQWGCKFP
jgi:hypothetical protein